jgi:replicative DNA helicase
VEDLDLAVVASLLREGKPALKRARERGLRPDLLVGKGKDVYQFLVEYHLRFDELPPAEIIQGKCGVVLPEISATLRNEFVVDEVFNRKTYEAALKAHRKIEGLLTATPPNVKDVVEAFESTVLDFRREQIIQSKVDSLFSLGPAVKEHYEKIKSGVRGILTPWPLLNDITLGFWPMDLVLFCARLGTGKTWTGVQLALCAWQQKKRVLFASTEISRLRIGIRLFALMGRFNYKDFTHATLTTFAEEKFYAMVDEFLQQEGLYVVGGNFDFRVEALSAAIDEVRPDFLILDGAYLLRTTGASRTDQAANAFNELKRLGIRHEIPIAATHQFNREVKTNVASSTRAESIGLTDVAGWNADLIFGMIQTDDMKRDRKMRMKPLKAREGAGEEIELNWDLDTMDFRELGIVTSTGQRGGGDAEEFDSGVRSESSSKGNSDPVPF